MVEYGVGKEDLLLTAIALRMVLGVRVDSCHLQGLGPARETEASHCGDGPG